MRRMRAIPQLSCDGKRSDCVSLAPAPGRRYSYLLVVHKHGELLYEGVHAVVKEHLASRLQRIVARTSNETLLSDVIDLWVDHKRDMGRINAILAFMVRMPHHARQNRRCDINVRSCARAQPTCATANHAGPTLGTWLH